ncbi:hypothetical protein [Deinococcus deserti]|uniref:Uncharacterized protein n=1 Tax=Deinococcus deserti (strain DSM 17065 / CIP 109153 / LMG 22923 / VCD115) TaxID=546414 RepID=C1D2T6_DEIDV|nr:hypothetical protein [Deinococcus deserti]ACO47725.2 Conserved hypothetical protein, precursor [Deinococcus deserti VCD115]
MRFIKFAFAALALSAITTASAAAAGVSHTVTLSNDIVDTIAVTGDVSISITALNTAVPNSTAKLSYSTHNDTTAGTTNVTTRKVTVASSAALPDGVTGTVSFTPATGNGTTAGAVNVGVTTAANLVTAIPRFITQADAALNYSFTASKGFDGKVITVTYVLADE